MKLLTKSKYINGLQCLRLLWFADKKQLPKVCLADQHRFNQGAEFENQVKRLFPNGIDLAGIGFNENLDRTKELIKEKKLIFEAGIKEKELFIRADILEPVKQEWDLYEIKSTTQVKPQHIPDLAFQKYVIEKSGIKINRCFLMFLNKEYVKNGEIIPKELISKEDITEQVELIDDIEQNTEKYLKIIKQENAPDIAISMNCNKPYECPLKDACWGTLPENNVLQLTNWRQYWKFFEEGIIDMKDIPKETKLSLKDEVIRDAILSKKVMISKEHIKHFIKNLHYPLYYFDFETFDTAVPLFDKSRPYQKIAFQYSLHIQQKNGNVKHFEYLATGEEDTRIKLLEQLKTEIGTKGDVIVFNKSFEVSVFNHLIEDFPEHADWIQNILNRIVDLAVPFQNFHYYSASQKGSYSIKKVLPAITGKGYELEINNGGDASAQYFYSHITHDLKNTKEIRKNLLKYCCLDTEAMVLIVEKLKKIEDMSRTNKNVKRTFNSHT